MAIKAIVKLRHATATFVIDPAKIERAIAMQMKARVLAGAQYLNNKCEQNVHVVGWDNPNRRHYTKSRQAKSKVPTDELNAKGKPKYKTVTSTEHYWPSMSGEYPRSDTGTLWKAIYRTAVEWDKTRHAVVAAVFTKLFYGKILELTSKPNGRPFLRRTLNEEKGRLTGIIAGTASASVKGGGAGGVP